MKIKLPLKKVFKTDESTHNKVLAFCKKRGKVVYFWVRETLINEINKEKE